MACAGSPVSTSMVRKAFGIDGIGFIAALTRMGSPLDIPPSIPPARLLRRLIRPSSFTTISSWAREPGRSASLNPSPISTPLIAWMPIRAPASAASRRRSDSTYVPSPAGTPYAMTSMTPPSVSADAFASSMRSIMRCSASLSRVLTGDASRASRSSGTGNGASSSMPTPPMEMTCATVRMDSACSRKFAATAPKATREAVSRALDLSRMGRASVKPYLRMPVRSACPGRGRLSGALRPVSGNSWSSGSALMTSVHLGHSVLPISMEIGEPKVEPWRTPVSRRT